MISLDNLTRSKLKEIYHSVGEREGWDFSRLNREKEELPWDYQAVVRNYLKKTDKVLDIGTAGAEFFTKLAQHFTEGVGIDFDPDMIKTARANLPSSLKEKISFKLMNAKNLDFPAGFFDLVINRHAPIYPQEISKVLKKKGHFITQQVGGENAQNIHRIFGWPSNAQYWASYYQSIGEDAKSMETLPDRFVDLGFQIIRQEDAKIKCWFKNIQSLMFWLKSVPLPEEIDFDQHWRKIRKVIQELSTPKGIQTIQHRQLLIVKK